MSYVVLGGIAYNFGRPKIVISPVLPEFQLVDRRKCVICTDNGVNAKVAFKGNKARESKTHSGKDDVAMGLLVGASRKLNKSKPGLCPHEMQRVSIARNIRKKMAMAGHPLPKMNNDSETNMMEMVAEFENADTWVQKREVEFAKVKELFELKLAQEAEELEAVEAKPVFYIDSDYKRRANNAFIIERAQRKR